MENFVGIVFTRDENRYHHITQICQVGTFMENRGKDGCQIKEIALLRDDDEFRAFIARETGKNGVGQTPANN